MISKSRLARCRFSQKTNGQIWFVCREEKKANKTNSSFHFLGKSMARQSAFGINWPLLILLKGCTKNRQNFSDYLKLISCTVLIFRFQFLLIESARKKSEANWSKTISFLLIEKMKKLSFFWLFSFCMHPTAIVQWWQSDF